MVCIGSGLGFMAALPLPKVFAAVFNDIDASDPRTYVMVLIATFVVALLASYIPARRASRVDPMTALRSE
jgi:putative ABC transport system permease protein